MHHYAISFPDSRVADPEWQEAMRASAIRRIEFSIGHAEDAHAMEEIRHRIAVLQALQTEDVLTVASIHIPFGGRWNIAHPDESARRKAVELILETFEFTAPLQCRDYTLHPSAEPIAPEDRRKAMEQSRRSLCELAPEAHRRGLRINVEDLPRTCLGRDEEEMAALLEGLPEEFGYCFDVNHFCNAADRCPGLIGRFGTRIRTFHFSDYDGIDECHWYPGLGVLDWVRVMDAVSRLPQEVLLIFETYGFVKAPQWQSRSVSDRIVCANAAKCACYLEHAAEFEARVRRFSDR